MLLKLFISAVFGAILGLERELRHKPGGVKTNALVSMASCAFVLIIQEVDVTETARVMTGIIQGVGFIGGGLILKAEKKCPKCNRSYRNLGVFCYRISL